MPLLFSTSIVVATILLNLVIAQSTTRMALAKGYSGRLGFFAGLLLGVLAPLLFLALPQRDVPQSAEDAEPLRQCLRCRNKVRVYEGFCTQCGARIE